MPNSRRKKFAGRLHAYVKTAYEDYQASGSGYTSQAFEKYNEHHKTYANPATDKALGLIALLTGELPTSSVTPAADPVTYKSLRKEAIQVLTDISPKIIYNTADDLFAQIDEALKLAIELAEYDPELANQILSNALTILFKAKHELANTTREMDGQNINLGLQKIERIFILKRHLHEEYYSEKFTAKTDTTPMLNHLEMYCMQRFSKEDTMFVTEKYNRQNKLAATLASYDTVITTGAIDKTTLVAAAQKENLADTVQDGELGKIVSSDFSTHNTVKPISIATALTYTNKANLAATWNKLRVLAKEVINNKGDVAFFANESNVNMLNELITETLQPIFNASTHRSETQECIEKIEMLFKIKRTVYEAQCAAKNMGTYPYGTKECLDALEDYCIERVKNTHDHKYSFIDGKYSRSEKLDAAITCYDSILKYGCIKSEYIKPAAKQGDLGVLVNGDWRHTAIKQKLITKPAGPSCLTICWRSNFAEKNRNGFTGNDIPAKYLASATNGKSGNKYVNLRNR